MKITQHCYRSDVTLNPFATAFPFRYTTDWALARKARNLGRGSNESTIRCTKLTVVSKWHCGAQTLHAYNALLGLLPNLMRSASDCMAYHRAGCSLLYSSLLRWRLLPIMEPCGEPQASYGTPPANLATLIRPSSSVPILVRPAAAAAASVCGGCDQTTRSRKSVLTPLWRGNYCSLCNKLSIDRSLEVRQPWASAL